MQLNIGDTVFFNQIECEVIDREYNKGAYIVEIRPINEDDQEAWGFFTVKRNEEVFAI